MKISTLAVIGSLIVLGGCASTSDRVQTASADREESYVPLGSAIPKKGKRGTEDQTADLQQLENARTMNNGTINSGK